MGENADMLLDGTLDFYTGEYIGKGYGIPRTANRSLPWEKNDKHKRANEPTQTKEQAYNGIKKYIAMRWVGRNNTQSVRTIIMEYTGEVNVDLKQKCIEIQKDFSSFVKFINQKIKNSK